MQRAIGDSGGGGVDTASPIAALLCTGGTVDADAAAAVDVGPGENVLGDAVTVPSAVRASVVGAPHPEADAATTHHTIRRIRPSMS